MPKRWHDGLAHRCFSPAIDAAHGRGHVLQLAARSPSEVTKTFTAGVAPATGRWPSAA
jgi:hypothetical protein